MLPAMPTRYFLRLLGGFELFGAGRALALPSRRAAAMLVCVAVDGGVTREALADRLWPGLDGAAARRNLRRELARLRDAGLGDLIVADAERLALADDVDSDLRRFTAACDGGDIAAALSAWSGSLLGDFGLSEAPEFDAWVGARRAALALRRRQAATAEAERLERAGDLREALAWHDRLRNEDPLLERHHAESMRLHHRLGEGAAALEVYEQCVRALRDGADADPMPSTTALAQRIRAAEALQPLVARGARGLPQALDAPLVGRDLEAQTVATTRAPVLLVIGEPGVGKTRLVNDVLRAPSTLVLRCEPKARLSALYPLAEALRGALLSPHRAARIAALPATVLSDAARLLPALAPNRADTDPEPMHRARFFDALGAVVDAAAGEGGVLWIDDLQWGDDATLELLACIAHRRAAGGAGHVRVVAAARTPDIDVDDTAAPRVRRLERAKLLERLALSPFAAEQTLELVRGLSGTAAGELFAARLQRATSGNPYHLMETLRFLFDTEELRVESDGTWVTRYDDATADYAELPVPPTLADTVIERTEQLGSMARQVVEAAAMARSGFTLAQLRPATALDPWQAVDGLEAALRLQLFVEAGAGDGVGTGVPRYRFAHDVAREALARALRPERRALIHERLAQALISQEGAADDIAWHLDEAGEGDAAVPWRLQAAAEARRLYAWRAMLEHLGMAFGATQDAALRVSIVDQRWEAARSLYALDAMAAAAADLAGLAADQGREDWRLQALVFEAELALLRKRPLPAIAALQQALDDGSVARHHPALRPRAVAALASAMLGAGQIDAASRVLATIDIEDRTIEPVWRAALLTAAGNAARLQRDASRAEQLLGRAIELLRSLGRLEARLHAQNLMAHVQYVLGDPARAASTLETTLDEALQAQLTVVLLNVLPNLAALCVATRQIDRAEAFLARAAQALRGIDHAATQAMLATHLADLRLARGDLGGVIEAARESIRLYEVNGGGTQNYAPWLALALVHDVAGDHLQAQRVIEGMAESPARAPGPAVEALVRLKRLEYRLGEASADEAVSIAGEFERLRHAPDGAYGSAEADFWQARALLRAGRPDDAQHVLDHLQTDGNQVGLYLTAASVLAVRLSCAAAQGSVPPQLLQSAQQAIDKAPPLVALELRHAVAAAQAVGSARDPAAPADRQLADMVEILCASLAAYPALSEGLRRRWLGQRERDVG